MDLRNKGTLLAYYFTPLVFFFVMAAVFSSTSPLMKTTLAASMSIFSVTMGAIIGAPAPLVKMRESGTIRAFKAAGIPGISTLAVSAVSAFIHLFIVSAVIYAVSPVVFHAETPASPGCILRFLPYSFLRASASVCLSAYARAGSLLRPCSPCLYSCRPCCSAALCFRPPCCHGFWALSGAFFPQHMPCSLFTDLLTGWRRI